MMLTFFQVLFVSEARQAPFQVKFGKNRISLIDLLHNRLHDELHIR